MSRPSQPHPVPSPSPNSKSQQKWAVEQAYGAATTPARLKPSGLPRPMPQGLGRGSGPRDGRARTRAHARPAPVAPPHELPIPAGSGLRGGVGETLLTGKARPALGDLLCRLEVPVLWRDGGLFSPPAQPPPLHTVFDHGIAGRSPPPLI